MDNAHFQRRIVDRDISGAPLFCEGACGFAHVQAHRLLDANRPEVGRQVLEAWLRTHDGSGPDWIHVQWHMAVFELATGRWSSAFERFLREIEPAVGRGDAYTDGPSLLWRLSLLGSTRVALPWRSAHDAAVRGLRTPCPAYVELHHLLALAGAGDVSAIHEWRRARRHDASSLSRHVLTRMAEGLAGFARHDYSRAAAALATGARQVWRLGGSRAQNELFELISQEARRRAEGNSVFAGRRAA